jgi:hypothetical protein
MVAPIVRVTGYRCTGLLIIAPHSLEKELERRIGPEVGSLPLLHGRLGAPRMPINRMIAQGSFDRPQIQRLQTAYEITLKALCLVDRNDPLTELVARKIIQIGEIGIDDPAQLSARAIKELDLH